MSDEMNDVQTRKEPMNDKDLNTDKLLIYVGEEIEQPSYKCPYPEAAVLLEKTRTLRAAGNMEWVEQAARYYDLYSHWLMCENGYEVENSKTAHKLYSWMCDGSQYLQTFFPDAIDEKRKDMERRIDGLRNRASALRIVEDKQTLSFIENMVYRLKASNYVIFPVRRAETLFYFLSYDHTLLKQELPLVAEALSLLKTNGLADSYVNVRIQSLLKQEIDQYEEIIAGLWFTEARQILELKITEAAGIIALALLNSDDPTAEGLNVPMLSARLCRYLSRLDTSLSAQLKNKAYTLLTGETTLEERLGWEDVVNFNLNHLMSRLVNIHIEELGLSDRQPGEDRWMQYSNGRNTLTLDHDGFTLSPLFPGKSASWRGRREKASLMDNRVFVALFGKPACLFADCADMAALRFYWHQLQEDFPLYLPADTLAEEEKQKGRKPEEEEEKDWPKPGESIKIEIVGLSADRQYLEGIVLDLAWRGEKAILPLTQINECYYLIPGFERHFQENTTYRVKVLERNREGIRVSLARSYNEFIYEENTQRKTLPAMYAGCEGGKTRWLLVTGSTCLTSSSRWVKPKIGEICQVEVKYADSHLLKPVVTAGKVKASVSKEEFMEEMHRHLQEFSDYCSGIHTQKMEEEAEMQLLKKRNNPFANALQKVDWASLVTTADTDAAAGQEPGTPRAGDGGKEDNAGGGESTCRGWLDAQAAVELLFCLDQLAKDLEAPEDRFNACNFLRMLCLFAGRRDNATYYELCADYLYAIHQMGTQPMGERLSPVNMERFGILLARMEQLGIKPYGITFEQCRNVINVLCSVADGDTVQLQSMVKSEDRTVAELARYFSMLSLLTERDTELQAIVFRNVNTLLGIREPGDKEAPVIPVCFGFEGVEREFKTSAFVHAGKEREEQSVVLARVIASFMNTDGGTLYIGVNDLGYLNGVREDLKFVHNDCDVYLRTVNRNIICLLGGGKEDYNRYQEYMRCDFHEYGPGRMVLAFRVPPVGEVVKLQNGKVYTRSGSSCICKPEENVDEFAALRRTLKLDSTPRKPEFPTFFSEERNEYIFMEQQPPQAEVTPAAEGASATGQVPATGEMASLPLFSALDADTPPAVQEEVKDSSSSVKKKSDAVKKEKVTLNVSTSTLRPNPLQKKVELGYNSNYAFVSLFQDGKIACSLSPKIGVWGGKGGKVLFSYDQEGTEELLVSVFTTGEVGISNLKKGFSAPNTPVAFVKNINNLLFCSPASKDKYLLLIAVKNEDKRYRIIRLSEFDKSMSVQPRLTLTLVPDKGEYIFAEILDEEMMKNIDDEKLSLDSFDEYNAGRIWEHTSYKNGLKQISEMCKLPY